MIQNTCRSSLDLKYEMRLIQDKDFTFLVMPGRNHGFGNEPYFTRRRWGFFVEHLMGAAPPSREEHSHVAVY